MMLAATVLGLLFLGCAHALKIDADGCGKRPLLSDNGESEINSKARIVGGAPSVPYSWPSICSFMTSTGYHICGSTLIKNKKGVYYLVTAAHCISQRRVRNYLARCGMHGISGNNPNSVLLSFSSLYMHPSYSEITFENDIAIFTLSSQPPTNNYTQAACVAKDPITPLEPAIVAGWGTLSYEGQMASELKQVNKPIKDKQTCAMRYPGEFDPVSMLCAGESTGGVDACQGDSGGPLYTYRNGEWTLTGVVSWGYGCAAPRFPGVYADVYNLQAWIDGVINA